MPALLTRADDERHLRALQLLDAGHSLRSAAAMAGMCRRRLKHLVEEIE